MNLLRSSRLERPRIWASQARALFGLALCALTPACPHKPPPLPPEDPPCDDVQSCWVGCGEGRDTDCVILASLARGQNLEERVTSRSVAEAACAASAPTGCALAGELWLPKHPKPLPPPGTFQLDEDIELTATKNAAALLDRGCGLRSPRACSLLGVLLVDGLGIKADPHRGEELLRWSCDKGMIESCYHAGLSAERVADYAGAAPFYQIACDKGIAASCRSLAALLDEPMLPAERPSLPYDEARARALYERACQLKDALACAAQEALSARVFPIERLVVQVFDIDFAGREDEEEHAKANDALVLIASGMPFLEVAATHADRLVTGELFREHHIVRMKELSPFEAAAFDLPQGGAVMLSEAPVRLQIVYRP